MTSDWNASTRHCHYLYFAALPYFYAPHHHFSFLISHSIEAFKRNQGASTPQGLTPNPIFPLDNFPVPFYNPIIRNKR